MARNKGFRKWTGPAVLAALLVAQAGVASGQTGLDREFQLGGEKSSETRYYRMITDVYQVRPDGVRNQPTSYRLLLEWIPAPLSGKEMDLILCHRLTVTIPGKPEASIPVLAGWQYELRPVAGGLDEKGQIFGIDQSRFKNLRDSTGAQLPVEVAYAAFNVFVDFHGFTSVFAAPTTTGAGIQDLKRLGQRIVHAAAFSEPPVSLSGLAETGSTFKNGEITLAFNGLSLIDGRPCALIHYDSGASSFTMKMQAAPNMNIKAQGASHYLGDLYVDLKSHWLTKADMIETVVVEVETPMSPNKIRQVIERQLRLEAVGKAEMQ